MIEITDRALLEFRRILSTKKGEEQAIRLVMGAGGCCGPALGIVIADKGMAGDVKIKNEACAQAPVAADQKRKGNHGKIFSNY